MLLNSEEERKSSRLAAGAANNVWEYRTEPPDDWATPLQEKPDRKPDFEPTAKSDTNSNSDATNTATS